MKIAYITSAFPYGSGEQFFEPEIHTLSQLGQQVLIVPARPRGRGDTPRSVYMPVLRLGVLELRTLRLAAAEVFSNPRRAWRALRVVLSSKYRLSMKAKNALLFPKALAVARELRREGIDHIHAHWLSTPSTVGYVASLLTGIPWSCTAHRFDIFQDNLLHQKAASARFIRAISDRNRQFLVERAPVAASRCKVVHLGVSVPGRVRGPANDRVVRILCAANMVPVKGHEFIVRALASLRDRGVPFECDFAGDGPLRAAIAAQIAKLRLNGFIRLRGVVPHERLCAELASGRYDLFVLASVEDGKEFEGIPVALMEAMAAGIPCIATRTGSIPELIEDGLSSRLVEQRDPQALANAIEQLAQDPALRIELGRSARERVLQWFDTQQTTKELFELIRGCEGAPA